MWAPPLLCHGYGDLGVAGAGALGARLDGEGEHKAVAGSRVGGHDESGVYRAFLPHRQILDACIARWVYGHIPMCIEALAVGVDDGRCKVDALAGCGAAVGSDLDNMRRMRADGRIMGTPLRAGGKVFLIGTQIGIEIVVCGRADGGKTGGRVRIGMPIKNMRPSSVSKPRSSIPRRPNGSSGI